MLINKKAIELSLNFIVVLVISLVLLGFGIRFISDLYKEAENLREITISDLDERIGSLVCSGSDRVCFDADKKTIKKKEFDVFGLKLINILEKQSFQIKVGPPPDYLGFKKDKTIIPAQSPKLIINPEIRPAVLINKNEERTMAIGVQVPANAVSGTYILNVDIKKQDGEPYASTFKLYVNVP